MIYRIIIPHPWANTQEIKTYLTSNDCVIISIGVEIVSRLMNIDIDITPEFATQVALALGVKIRKRLKTDKIFSVDHNQ